jgi:hypothetical protein
MKKILLFLYILLSTTIYSQDKVGIYYENQSGDQIKLDYSRITGTNVGNIAGAYFTLGLSSANSNYVISGKASETEIKEIKDVTLQFVVYFGNDDLTKYIFSNPANMDYIVLVKLHQKKKTRNLRNGKYGLTAGIQKGLNEDDVISIKSVKINDSLFRVTPREKLKKGEYCFYYTGDAPEGINEFNGVFDFALTK